MSHKTFKGTLGIKLTFDEENFILESVIEDERLEKDHTKEDKP